MTQHYISKSFRLSIINFGFFVISYIAGFLIEGSPNYGDNSALFVGIPLLIAGILAFVGLVQLIKGRNEKKNYKFYLALIVHGLIGILWVYAFSVTLMDFSRLF
ncbi:hypothetical protein SAMN06265375_1181 [Muriicola jejuensis]|nr:hypothetical protein SAMN06265375_1181 [Muriicola jejuensis]